MATTSATGRLSGVTALVTGGSRGIGEGCVRCLHEEGANVVFCSNEPVDGQAVEASLGKERALFVEADCRVEADIYRTVQAAIDRFGGLDCLVNNVGGLPPPGTIDVISADQFRSLFELNVMSYFLFSKAALPHLRKSKRSPSIVNIGSMVGSIGMANGPIYVATKGAVVALTKALAMDEGVNEVRVNSISPSNIRTPLQIELIHQMVNGDDADKQVEELKQKFSSFQVHGRIGLPKDIGKACAYLASSDARFITGIDLYLSGGSELGYGRKSDPKPDPTD